MGAEGMAKNLDLRVSLVLRWLALTCIGGLISSPQLIASEIVDLSAKPEFMFVADSAHPKIVKLGWDTEDGKRAETNLLRENESVSLEVHQDGKWQNTYDSPSIALLEGSSAITYTIRLSNSAQLIWRIEYKADHFTISLDPVGPQAADQARLTFPFDPRKTPTTLLTNHHGEDRSFHLPGILSAPDFGQLLVTDPLQGVSKIWLKGSRSDTKVDMIFELSLAHRTVLEFSPVVLPPPDGLKDLAAWKKIRRSWFNIFQASAEWGDVKDPFSAPAGVLANNVVSDPVSFTLGFYADEVLWTPELAPGVSGVELIRESIDFWLNQRLLPTGELIGYWKLNNFLDSNAGPLTAAWDSFEASKQSPEDYLWLSKRIEKFEILAEFLAKRDIDGDGMVETVRSGNRGVWSDQLPGTSWWDAVNSGYKDGYTNALVYRAWRCLADLEAKLNRVSQKRRYDELADKLKKAYVQTLYNPRTGWLGWWRSEDGELHDYASPIVNGIAIDYGLVEPAWGQTFLNRLWRKMWEVKFTRFDLGVPSFLIPVNKSDYHVPNAFGSPRDEDGRDTFGQYMNGGILGGQGLNFIMAHYMAHIPWAGDKILNAMLERQERGLFQNGVQNSMGRGIDWTDWNGKPAGYEGFLADNYRFLQAVVLREYPFRKRFYKILIPWIFDHDPKN